MANIELKMSRDGLTSTCQSRLLKRSHLSRRIVSSPLETLIFLAVKSVDALSLTASVKG